jgi:arginine/serine-rich splicing factor 4/5/6
VYMDDERDAEDAIKGLDNIEFGRQRCRLCVEWAKQGDGAVCQREDACRSIMKHRPTKTLFVVNFDPIETRVRDLECHFEPYGKLVRVHIHKNFGFVQYETQEEATKALESTNMR